MTDVIAYLEEQGMSLSEQQKAAVLQDSGSVLLLAVPGAGKTSVLTARAAHLLLNCGCTPEDLLILSYNRESARDMARRWEMWFSELLPDCHPRFSTIHSFCYRLLREYAQARGTQVPRLMEEPGGSGRSNLLRNLYLEINQEFPSDDQLSELDKAIGFSINRRLKAEEQHKITSVAHFPELYRRYTCYKREHGVMDFDDMLLFACTALERHPNFRKKVSERYRCLMVDEAQDVSLIQHDILRLLARDNLFLVGDEDQSIYGFRGAEPGCLVEFRKWYPNGKILKLEQNYRSTPEIVSAADRVIQRSQNRYAKQIFTQRKPGYPVRVIRDYPLERSYQAIAKEAVRLAGYGSCAVLYRNSVAGLGVAECLRQMRQPYSAHESRLSFRTDFVVRDVINYFRLSSDLGCETAFHQLYFKLNCGIRREQEQEALSARPADFLGWLMESEGISDRYTARMSYVRRQLIRMQKQTPLEKLKTICESLDYLENAEYSLMESQFSVVLERMAVLRCFAEFHRTDEDFLEAVQQSDSLLDSTAETGIRLSTVHSAKGQEYKSVILADVFRGVFPAGTEGRMEGTESAAQEETRIFYTAMTRARDSLTIYAPDTGLGRSLPPCPYLWAVEGNTSDAIPFEVGTVVFHVFFGRGQIVELNRQRKLVTVSFRNYGNKMFDFDSLSDKKLFEIIR